MNTKTTEATAEIAAKLRDIGFKIRGLAYLLENQNASQVVTSATAEKYYGLGAILDDLGRRINRISRDIDQWASDAPPKAL